MLERIDSAIVIYSVTQSIYMHAIQIGVEHPKEKNRHEMFSERRGHLLYLSWQQEKALRYV